MSWNNLFIQCVQCSLCVIKRAQTLQEWRHFMGPGNLSATAAAASSRHDELPDRFRNAVNTQYTMMFSESSGIESSCFPKIPDNAILATCFFLDCVFLATLAHRWQSIRDEWLISRKCNFCVSVGSVYLLCNLNTPFLTMNGDHRCMCNTLPFWEPKVQR